MEMKPLFLYQSGAHSEHSTLGEPDGKKPTFSIITMLKVSKAILHCTIRSQKTSSSYTIFDMVGEAQFTRDHKNMRCAILRNSSISLNSDRRTSSLEVI